MLSVIEILLSTCCVTHLCFLIAIQQIEPQRPEDTKHHKVLVNLSPSVPSWSKN
jgi:hypothetical protein